MVLFVLFTPSNQKSKMIQKFQRQVTLVLIPRTERRIQAIMVATGTSVMKVGADILMTKTSTPPKCVAIADWILVLDLLTLWIHFF